MVYYKRSHRRRRTQKEYEFEIAEAAKRMKKYPEHLRSARDSEVWYQFLINKVQINPDTIDSTAGMKFWEDVRNEIKGQEPQVFTERQILLQKIEVTERELTMQRLDVAEYTRGKQGKTQIVYRDVETGKFVSKKVDRY